MNRVLAELEAIPIKQTRGLAFEHVVRWLLRTAPLYREQLTDVWLWDEYPEAWGADTGIDLLARDANGKLWAVQAKAYREDASLTWRDISTFIGASASRSEVDVLLLVTTADTVSPNAWKQLALCGKPFAVLTREGLFDLDLPDVGLDDLRPVAPDRFTPRDHQREALDAIEAGFADATRGQLILACGTGKTLTALWARERLGSTRTLVFVPSLALLAQTLRAWARHARRTYTALAVCSDDTVPGGDAWTSSAAEVGIPPTTDPEELRKALMARDDVVVFATYQSSKVIEEAATGTGSRFDLMVCDEAHRATGLGTTAFTRPLDEELIPADRRLFMTATPRVYRARSKRKAEGEELVLSSMDDPNLYGKCFYTLSFAQAIERDLLTDYRVVVVGVDDTEVAELIEKRVLVTVDGDLAVDAGELAAHIAIAKAMKRFGSRRMISFHSRIKRSEGFANRFPEVLDWLGPDRRPAGTAWAASVKGAMPVRTRRKILDRLARISGDEVAVVCNARCLGEGVDVPLIDGIAFVDPKNSQQDIVQAVGRAIRKAAGKDDRSTIVLPVPIAGDGDVEVTLGASAFKTVWQVINALRAHDEAFGEQLDELRRGLGRRTEAKVVLPDRLVLDLPERVGLDFAEAIAVRVVERTTSRWEEGIARLLVYVGDHGHARVPQPYVTADGFRLGTWLTERRTEYRQQRLAPERIAALEGQPGWTWNVNDTLFEEGLAALKRFVRERGHSTVSAQYIAPDGFKLGSWVRGQQQQYKNGRLTVERIAVLETVEDWAWSSFDRDFRSGLARLLEHVEEHGTPITRRDYVTSDGFPLGSWISSRRQEMARGQRA